MSLAPIALFVYNRPTHTLQTLEALKRDPLAAQSDLIIFSDAPRTEADRESVAEVRAIIAAVDGFRTLEVVLRGSNFGLAKSIINGVTLLCDRYGSVIVLEDDLLVSTGFLKFMNRALVTYAAEKKVMQVSGYMFPAVLEGGRDSLFLPFTSSWGWATWKRAWTSFDEAASGYGELVADRSLAFHFDLDGTYSFRNMLEKQLRGEIDSWAIRWYLSVFLNKGVVLYPARSLVLNIGFDGSGTHCDTSTIALVSLDQAFEVHTLPIDPQVNEVDRDAMVRYFREQGGNRIKRGLRRVMAGVSRYWQRATHKDGKY